MSRTYYAVWFDLNGNYNATGIGRRNIQLIINASQVYMKPNLRAVSPWKFFVVVSVRNDQNRSDIGPSTPIAWCDNRVGLWKRCKLKTLSEYLRLLYPEERDELKQELLKKW